MGENNPICICGCPLEKFTGFIPSQLSMKNSREVDLLSIPNDQFSGETFCPLCERIHTYTFEIDRSTSIPFLKATPLEK